MFRSWYFAARYLGARFFGGGPAVSTAPVTPSVTIRDTVTPFVTIRDSVSPVVTISR